jgi:hypothetical protein
VPPEPISSGGRIVDGNLGDAAPRASRFLGSSPRRGSSHAVSTFEPRLGIVLDLGATWNLPRRNGRRRAIGVTMLGARVSAEQAAEWRRHSVDSRTYVR